MKKLLYIGIFLGISMSVNPSFGQTNDEKAIDFLNNRMQTVFKVLNSKPKMISPTCMDSLKKLHDYKEQILKDSNPQKDIDITILKALYMNSIQFCETDVQAICNKRAEPTIRKICTELSMQSQ